MFELGIDVLLRDSARLKRLKGRKVGLLSHPAGVTRNLEPSFDVLAALSSLGSAQIQLACAFGPQHGMRGEKQDNMIESDDYTDPLLGIPVYSLYGQVRRPTTKMMDSFEVLLVDLQDVGCRIYTFLTTLFYMMEACAEQGKELWVLDRPNPAGRPVEGNYLRPGYESFVGAAPLPMRHGLTLGEAALWYRKHKGLELELDVVAMQGYHPETGPGFGWPMEELSWVNPSPNMPRLSNARQYAGTVLFEGTNFSEGRGTTIPLEVFGAPGWSGDSLKQKMLATAPQWLRGCRLRACHFEPTFHKFSGELCGGLQVHVDASFYHPQEFKPYRMASLFLKSVRELYPDFALWRDPPYEYEAEKLPIEILSGSGDLVKWVEDPAATPGDWDEFLAADEKLWLEERQEFLLY